MGSTVEGHLIKDIEWPEECLLVGIKRGGKEIIPNGDTEILAGDFLVVLVDDDKAAGSMEALQKLSTEIKE